nr:substrate-binding domain-containing protein [Streptomyces canarius]
MPPQIPWTRSSWSLRWEVGAGNAAGTGRSWGTGRVTAPGAHRTPAPSSARSRRRSVPAAVTGSAAAFQRRSAARRASVSASRSAATNRSSPRPARASSGAATGPAAGAAAGALIERGCTAVVCASDMMALGAVRAARQAGLQVPRYFSVAGFDDSPLIAFTDPPLTTIRKPVPAMGQAAVRTLLEEVGGTPAPHSEFVFMPELVVRGSTASQPRARHSAA